MQSYPRVGVGANVYAVDLVNANDIVRLSSNYREMQGLIEAVNHHAKAVVEVGT